MDENSNSELKINEEILIKHLQENISDIFTDSFRHLSNSVDAISFAYGWLMLSYSMEYQNIYNKLIHLQEYYGTNTPSKDLSFIIAPIKNIVQILKLNDEVLALYNIVNLTSENKPIIEKFLYDNLNIFLIKFYKTKDKLEELSILDQKTSIDKLIEQINSN